MLKKLTTIGLIITMLASTSIPIFADPSTTVNYFNRDIYVNGEKIANYQSATPYFSCGNNVYVPLTAENGKILGFTTKVDTEAKTVELAKAESTQKNYANQSAKHRAQRFTAQQTDYKLFYNPGVTIEQTTTDETLDAEALTQEGIEEAPVDADSTLSEQPDAAIADGNIEEENSRAPKDINLGEAPIFTYNNVPYVAIGILNGIESLGWSSHFDSYTGLYISTNPDIAAKSYVNAKTMATNKNLVDYMIKINGAGLTVAAAQDILFLIKQKSQIYKVDELLVISVIAKESRFNVKAQSKSGANGLMQVMTATGAKAGLSKADLIDAEKNLEFGVSYLSGAIKSFDSEWVRGLSAYNQGSTKVSRGNFSRAYYQRVISAYNVVKTKVVK